MKANTLKFILVVSLVLNISVFISAGYTYYRQHQIQHTPSFPCELHKGNGYPFEKLGLNPEQLKAFKEKAYPFHADVAQKRHEIFQKRAELMALIRSENPDKQAIDAKIGEISRMQEGMQKVIVAHMLEVKSVLNGDQQKKLFDLIEETMAGRMDLPCR
ncbi:MAG TPA: periplasmic heavy metal sensor [Deltaproteobacteria bacterium]|jgi:Spy/CpxP family protein refolding chaperone|nr:periplasmic heavy metal sensor [Deltaproteobacteria bacterium]HQH99874.1 periplasmic heavy metal sensor [Deltaproteobacteria bacterium]HQJ08599.1 periplasmic heavy metal sensor [Deltaproteobacteria bacterium]